MTFAWPYVLALLLLPIALLTWELTHRRRAAAAARPKILRAEAGARSLTLSNFNAQPSTSTVAKPRYWLCAGLALVIVALARPQWGRLEEPVFDQSREILLAVDLSRSMLAEDIKPSRLERAKLLIQSLLEKLVGERVGLVVFSGTAFLQSPLSADYEILREFLPALGPDFLPEGGSNYGALLDTALQAFGTAGAADRFLIILSDGEATDESWRSRVDDKGATVSRLEELKNRGIRVIGLGVGTAGGAMIPDGGGAFVKDERGAVVVSKLESATLQELAETTNGVYRDASTWIDLAALVQQTIETGRKGEFVEKHTVRLAERFQWPLALGLWCLLVSFCYEFPVRPRVRELRLAPPERGEGRKEKATTGAVAAFAALFLLPASVCVVPDAHGAAAASAASSEAPPLAKIVGRLADADQHSARDWAELSRETVNWGARLQSEQHPVPEGPVRDALSAVDLGEKMNPELADWPKLREELEALLKKSEEQQQQQQQQDQKQDQQDQQQQQQNQDQQPQDQKSKQQNEPQQENSGSQQNDPSSAQPPEKKDEEKEKPGESAFGDMSKKEEPPPPPPSSQETQKVGGNSKQEENKEPYDPSLAIPMQKLEELREQDSPAKLFELLEGERKPTKKTGKDW